MPALPDTHAVGVCVGLAVILCLWQAHTRQLGPGGSVEYTCAADGGLGTRLYTGPLYVL